MNTNLRIGIIELAMRLIAATLVGGLIGLNRELKGKPAGLRTHALVTLGSALVTVVGVYSLIDKENSDPSAISRIIQGIITGIGFLGAGVILRDEINNRVRGLTTAATIWVSASIGIACGVGAWYAVMFTTALILVVLIVGGPIEQAMLRWIGRRKPDEIDVDEPVD
jgi:putative Mg2+ transporter-C (MgtC) family protein